MDLTPEQIERLRTSRGWLRKRDQAYGRTLTEVVRDAEYMQFLMDAVDTGHAPDLDGIIMALEAHALVSQSEARTHVASGKPHFARGDLYGTADSYRALAEQLNAEAETLEALGQDLGVRRLESATG